MKSSLCLASIVSLLIVTPALLLGGGNLPLVVLGGLAIATAMLGPAIGFYYVLSKIAESYGQVQCEIFVENDGFSAIHIFDVSSIQAKKVI